MMRKEKFFSQQARTICHMTTSNGSVAFACLTSEFIVTDNESRLGAGPSKFNTKQNKPGQTCEAGGTMFRFPEF